MAIEKDQFLSPEQAVVDAVRYELMGGDIPALQDVAGVMVVASRAYRQGVAHQWNQEVDPESAIRTAFSGHGAFFEKLFDCVMESEDSRKQVEWAFEEGQKSRG